MDTHKLVARKRRAGSHYFGYVQDVVVVAFNAPSLQSVVGQVTVVVI